MRNWYGREAERSGPSLPAGYTGAAVASQKNEAGKKKPAEADDAAETGGEAQKGQTVQTAAVTEDEKEAGKEQPAVQAAAPDKKDAAEEPQKVQERKEAENAATDREQNEKKTGKQPAADGGGKGGGKSSGDSVTYFTYEVQRGDTFWLIARKFGIPMAELLAVNKMTENTILYEGMTLTIPQHHIPKKSTPGPQYGELLDWWTEAQYLWPIGTDALVTDLATGKSFHVRRSYGANHADAEPLTTADSAVMKEIWGGWSWAARPVIVTVNGRKIAASSHAMPHSIETIADNDFDGHFCIHFLNSTRHSDNQMQADHQDTVRRAAGLM
ncbi:MAG: LysM peptidoglycan-binding domain-containing protein [Firmicutes bacterium]|nr:LysM peptidoglycan-binding domain-containing protein [Bacillota bacterium]